MEKAKEYLEKGLEAWRTSKDIQVKREAQPTDLGSVFGLQEQSALKWTPRSHMDSDLGDLYMDGKLRR
jgi:hypothetical protein